MGGRRANAMTSEVVTLEHLAGHVARVVLNRPQARNAVNAALARRITRNAPVALRESLQIARQAADLDAAQLRALSLQARQRVQATED